MKLILTTLMTVLSIVGLIISAYFEKWDVVFLSSPFSLQFTYALAIAYNKHTQLKRRLNELNDEVQDLKRLNQRLKHMLSKAGS